MQKLYLACEKILRKLAVATYRGIIIKIKYGNNYLG